MLNLILVTVTGEASEKSNPKAVTAWPGDASWL